MEISAKQFREVKSKLESKGAEFGLEIFPFKIKWYNDAVIDKKFELDNDPNTLAFIVISTPSMFEKAFLPYIKKETTKSKFEIEDPLDQCMKKAFLSLTASLKEEYDPVYIHDFEISSVTKRPKVLVQTAGHVAGAVRLYQKSDINEALDCQSISTQLCTEVTNYLKSSEIFPVCLHAKYGGWFALRGIILLKNVRIDDEFLRKKDPPNILKSKYEIANLLHAYNKHWRDWRYRDFGLSSNLLRYSALQKKYFGTEPCVRNCIITRIIEGTEGVLTENERAV